jgi:hypothetical protein
MGTVAVPAFAADAAAMRGLEFTDEPKYAAEVDVDLDLQESGAAAAADDDDDGLGAQELPKTAVASGSAAIDASGGGTATAAGGASGRTHRAAGAAEVTDVDKVAGGSDVEGSGPVLLQQVGVEQLQQGGIGAATAAQPSSATDARHLGAIFGGDPFGT